MGFSKHSIIFEKLLCHYTILSDAKREMENQQDRNTEKYNLTKMILRKAAFLEAPVIWEILQQAIYQRKKDGSKQWQNGYPNEQTVHNDITNGNAYVLIDDEVIIAYTAIIFGVEAAYSDLQGRWLSNDNYAVVHRVAASNLVRGKGVATHLFKMIEDVCIEQKTYSIKVDTNFDNVPMMKILDKLNYTYCGEIFFSGAPRKAYEKLLHRIELTKP